MSDFVRVCKVGDIPDPGKQVSKLASGTSCYFTSTASSMPWTTCAPTTAARWAKACSKDIRLPVRGTAAKFDIRDGRVLCMPAVSGTPSHDVKVEGDEVFVKIVDRPKKKYVWG